MESDIGRGMAARYGIPLAGTPAEALTLGGKHLAVDGVLIIGEHGNFPHNEKGQKLYPRRRLLEETVKVFPKLGAQRTRLQRQAFLVLLGRRGMDV